MPFMEEDMGHPAALSPIKIGFFILLCLVPGLIVPAAAQPLRGSGTATINGTLDAGEWTNAGTVDLAVKIPAGLGGGTATGKLYVMNDSSTLYLAVRVDRSLKSAVSAFLFVQFDNDNDGLKESGDDILLIGLGPASPPRLDDRVLVATDLSSSDVDRGGTNDLQGQASWDGTYFFLEISHPLDSADHLNDFSLTSGQVIGFKLTFQIWGDGAGETPYPPTAVPEFAQIQIAENLCFPQFGAGGGLSSQIVLTNPSSQKTATAQVQVTDDLGLPVPVAFSGLGSNGTVDIPPLGSVTLTGVDPGKLTVGSAVVNASQQIGGTIRFEISGIGIAGVGAGAAVEAFIAPVRRTAGSINTGVAIRNLGATATRLEFSLRKENGQVVPEGSYVIESFPGRGHLAKFIDELFSKAQLNNFVGTLVVRSSGSLISAIALELGGKPGMFTTLPVIPLKD